MNTIDTDVVIVGAGPTGLTLAGALEQRGIRTVVLDRQREGANTSRAAVVHSRTLEMLERLGVVERLVERGVHAARFSIRDRDRVLVPIQFDQLPTRYPFTLMISQAATEAVLRERLTEVGGRVLWCRTVASVEQDESGVTATLEGGTRVRGRYLVGADGMHSIVRETLGVGFPGAQYQQSFSLADVRLAGDVPRDEVLLYFSPEGFLVVAPLRTICIASLPRSILRRLRRMRHSSRRCWIAGDLRASERWWSRSYGVRGSTCTTVSPRRIAKGACCSPAMPRTCTVRPAGRA